jgi:hypothetical protein
MSEYPEHEKLTEVADLSQAIGEFLDGCGYTLCEVLYLAPYNGPGGLSREPSKYDQHGRFYPVSKSVQALLADYFEIDLDAIEREKRAMLEAIRAV